MFSNPVFSVDSGCQNLVPRGCVVTKDGGLRDETRLLAISFENLIFYSDGIKVFTQIRASNARSGESLHSRLNSIQSSNIIEPPASARRNII